MDQAALELQAQAQSPGKPRGRGALKVQTMYLVKWKVRWGGGHGGYVGRLVWRWAWVLRTHATLVRQLGPVRDSVNGEGVGEAGEPAFPAPYALAAGRAGLACAMPPVQ